MQETGGGPGRARRRRAGWPGEGSRPISAGCWRESRSAKKSGPGAKLSGAGARSRSMPRLCCPPTSSSSGHDMTKTFRDVPGLDHFAAASAPSVWPACWRAAGAGGDARPLYGTAFRRPKAKHVIFLFMTGGPSQLDMFDPKPLLSKYAGQRPPSVDMRTERVTGGLLPSTFDFKKYGQSGIDVSELLPHLASMHRRHLRH